MAPKRRSSRKNRRREDDEDLGESPTKKTRSSSEEDDGKPSVHDKRFFYCIHSICDARKFESKKGLDFHWKSIHGLCHKWGNKRCPTCLNMLKGKRELDLHELVGHEGRVSRVILDTLISGGRIKDPYRKNRREKSAAFSEEE